MFSRFGDPNWWFGKNSFFASATQTLGDSGMGAINLGLGGTTNQQPGQTAPQGIDPALVKYGGLALLIYLVAKK
jgi:hypothetical protein